VSDVVATSPSRQVLYVDESPSSMRGNCRRCSRPLLQTRNRVPEQSIRLLQERRQFPCKAQPHLPANRLSTALLKSWMWSLA